MRTPNFRLATVPTVIIKVPRYRTTTMIDTAEEAFICPLTLEVMIDPVMNRNGHSFERVAILTWLRKQGTCPLTRKPMKSSDFVVNCRLRQQIMDWRQERGEDITAFLHGTRDRFVSEVITAMEQFVLPTESSKERRRVGLFHWFRR
jgi:U-box domain